MSSLAHAGKLIAQGAHAANQAVCEIGKGQFGPKSMAQFQLWEKQTPTGFGTTIVLGGSSGRGFAIDDIHMVVNTAIRSGFAAGITVDPGYPLNDGKTTHSFPCETCGWIFGSRSELTWVLAGCTLFPAVPSL